MAGGVESKWSQGTRQSASEILHAGSVNGSPRALMAVSQYVQADRVPEYKSPVAQALFSKRFPGASAVNGPKAQAVPGSRVLSVPGSTTNAPYSIVPKMGYYATANHEAEHAYNQTPKTVDELGPSIGDLVFMGEQFSREQGKPLQHRVQLPGGVSHDINWMREQAAKHGYWDGASMNSLLATPEGKQWLSRMDRPADAPFSPSGVYPRFSADPGSSPSSPTVSSVPNERQPQLSTLKTFNSFNLPRDTSAGQAIMNKQQRQPDIGNYPPSPIVRASTPLAPSAPLVPEYPQDTNHNATLLAQQAIEGKKDMGISQLYPTNSDVRRMSNPAAGRDNRFIPQNMHATQMASDAQVRGPLPGAPVPEPMAQQQMMDNYNRIHGGPTPTYPPRQFAQPVAQQPELPTFAPALGSATRGPLPGAPVLGPMAQQQMMENDIRIHGGLTPTYPPRQFAQQPELPTLAPALPRAATRGPLSGPVAQQQMMDTVAPTQPVSTDSPLLRAQQDLAARMQARTNELNNSPEQAAIVQAAKDRFLQANGPSMQDQARRVGTEADRMAEARVASEARLANPSTVPYGARNVVSPLQGDAAHFQGMASRESAQNAADTQHYSDNISEWNNRLKADTNGNGIPDRDESVSTKFGGVGIHNINDLGAINAKYNIYMSGYRSDRNAMATSRPMSFDEFAKNEQDTFKKRPVFGVDAPSNIAAGPYEMAREKVQIQREQNRMIAEQRRAPRVEMARNQGIQSSIIANALARGFNPQQANALAANAMASRFDAGQAQATRETLLQQEFMKNQAAVQQSQIQKEGVLGTANINAGIAEKQNILQNALLQSGISQKDKEFLQSQQEYTDGKQLRDLQFSSLKRTEDQAVIDAKRLQDEIGNPEVVLNNFYTQKYEEILASPSVQSLPVTERIKYAREAALPLVEIQARNMRAMGGMTPDQAWNPPAMPGPPPAITVPGASKGIATGVDLTKMYADLRVTNPDIDPSLIMQTIATDALRDGWIVNQRSLDDLHKNATAMQAADNNQLWHNNFFGGIPFFSRLMPQTGTPDQLAKSTYKALVGEDPVDLYAPFAGTIQWPHNRPEVQKRISPLMGR